MRALISGEALDNMCLDVQSYCQLCYTVVKQEDFQMFPCRNSSRTSEQPGSPCEVQGRLVHRAQALLQVARNLWIFRNHFQQNKLKDLKQHLKLNV